MDALHDTDEIEDTIFNAMPATWRDDHGVMSDLHGVDLDLLITRMEKQDRLSKRNNASKSKNGSGNGKQDNCSGNDNDGGNHQNQNKQNCNCNDDSEGGNTSQ